MRRAALIAACSLVTACSVVASFDGLVGSGATATNDGGATTEGGVVGVDGSSVVDATDAVDGTSAGDGATLDATSSGGDTGSDSSVDMTFCGTHPGHTICDDFNETSFAAVWSPNVGNGAVSLSTVAPSTSPPGSLFTRAAHTGNGEENDLQHTFASASSSIVIDGNFYVEGSAYDVDFVYASFDTGTSSTWKRCYIDIDEGPTLAPYLEVSCDPLVPVDGGGGYYDSVDLTANPLTGYHRFKLAIDLTTKTVTATLDGTTSFKRALPEVFSNVTTVVTALGVGYLGNNSVSVHADDVLIDVN